MITMFLEIHVHNVTLTVGRMSEEEHFVSVSISKLACSKISFLSENDDLTVSVNYSVFKMTVVT